MGDCTVIENIAAIELRSVSKDFPGVHALSNVNVAFRKGEVHAIVGQNGAGKSTIVKILAGVHKPDSGSILINGRVVNMDSPQDARRLGLAVIYQEFQLIPSLSVAENMFLGREPRRRGAAGLFIDWRRLRASSRAILSQLGSSLNPGSMVSDLRTSDQQIVEIAKALSTNAEIILMDEPTASLTAPEIKRLFAIITALRDRGVTVIYISHRMEEVFDIADSITVFTDGRCVATTPIGEITIDGVIRLMIGRKLEDMYPGKETHATEEALRVSGLGIPGLLHDISFSLCSGEVLGIFGFIGSGRTELARALFGAEPALAGRIEVFGKEVRIRSVLDAIHAGIALVVEDRKRQGLLLEMSVLDNICIASLDELSRMGFIDARAARAVGKTFVDRLDIKTPSLEHSAKNLSGGNQQKVIVAKWLNRQSPIIIFDEPTRGIDVGAKVEMYQIIRSLAEKGSAVIVISSDLSEVLGISDRLIIMRAGRIIGQSDTSRITKEEVLNHAIGTVNRN
jgi:ribose transport system ATP-binding protein